MQVTSWRQLACKAKSTQIDHDRFDSILSGKTAQRLLEDSERNTIEFSFYQGDSVTSDELRFLAHVTLKTSGSGEPPEIEYRIDESGELEVRTVGDEDRELLALDYSDNARPIDGKPEVELVKADSTSLLESDLYIFCRVPHKVTSKERFAPIHHDRFEQSPLYSRHLAKTEGNRLEFSFYQGDSKKAGDHRFLVHGTLRKSDSDELPGIKYRIDESGELEVRTVGDREELLDLDYDDPRDPTSESLPENTIPSSIVGQYLVFVFGPSMLAIGLLFVAYLGWSTWGTTPSISRDVPAGASPDLVPVAGSGALIIFQLAICSIPIMLAYFLITWAIQNVGTLRILSALRRRGVLEHVSLWGSLSEDMRANIKEIYRSREPVA